MVLGEGSLIPPENLVRPAPNQFTHELVEPVPFYLATEAGSQAPDGRLEAGSAVVLLRYEGGTRCRVVDERGLYVEVPYRSLGRLSG